MPSAHHRHRGIARVAAALAGLLLALTGQAQELVVNPGLELYSRCPPGIGVIDTYADNWWRGGLGSTDYLNVCGYYPVPARTGSAHAGLIPWDASGPYREYLVGELTGPLVAGSTYRVEFWVILNEGHTVAVEELGAWFSPTRLPPFPGTGPPAGVVPQVEHAGGPIVDKVNWTQVSGTFVAGGGEQFLTIGNFHDDAGTTTFRWPCCGAVQSYYYVDDVSVTEVISNELDVDCTVVSDTCGLNAAATDDGRYDFGELLEVAVVLTNLGSSDLTGYGAVVTAAGATVVSPPGGVIDVATLEPAVPVVVNLILQLPDEASGASCGDPVDLDLTGQIADQGTWVDDELAGCDILLGGTPGECGLCAAPRPCLWRRDATSLSPLLPPASDLFMPETVDGLTLQGPAWQCPLRDGDVEQDALALRNGVPLSFYQVDEAIGSLLLEKAGTTIRFRL